MAGLLALALLPFVGLCAWQLCIAATTQRVLSLSRHEQWVGIGAGGLFWMLVAVWAVVGLVGLAVAIEFGLQAVLPRQRPSADDDDPEDGQ